MCFGPAMVIWSEGVIWVFGALYGVSAVLRLMMTAAPEVLVQSRKDVPFAA